jgi:hypothetical protein
LVIFVTCLYSYIGINDPHCILLPRPKHARSSDVPTGCRCLAPSGHNAASLCPHCSLQTRLPKHVCADGLQPMHRLVPAMPPPRVVASLHTVTFAVTANRHPRHRVVFSDAVATFSMVFIMPSGSSSPTSSTTAAILQVTYMPTLDFHRFHLIHLHYCPLDRQCHILIPKCNFSSTPTTTGCTDTSLSLSSPRKSPRGLLC